MNNKGFWYKLGYKFGTIAATTVFLCALTIIVALTIKFLFWLF